MKKYLPISIIFILFSWSANSQQSPAAGFMDRITNTVAPRATPASEMIVNTGDHFNDCRNTATNAVRECLEPTGFGFKEAIGLLSTAGSVATSFMGGDDPGKMAEMCQITQALGGLSNLVNGGQDRTCQEASAACQTRCNDAFEAFKAQERVAVNNRDQGAITEARFNQEEVQRFDSECQARVQAQMQLAQQQQQANQAPMAGAEACQNALNSDDDFEEELVDCSLAQYANSAQCTTLGITDGNGIPFEAGQTITQDNSATDFPGDEEDREAFWDALKNRTSGNAGRGGAGAGGAGPTGGGPGGGSGGNNRAGGAARKSGSTLLSGGNESSGGGGGGFNLGGDDDFNKKFAKLDAKKKKLNMLTKKKIGGRGIASSEFGLASDDIWTRVYLRTNTRCTKQLTECTANKSLNPYGVSNKAR